MNYPDLLLPRVELRSNDMFRCHPQIYCVDGLSQLSEVRLAFWLL